MEIKRDVSKLLFAVLKKKKKKPQLLYQTESAVEGNRRFNVNYLILSANARVDLKKDSQDGRKRK